MLMKKLIRYCRGTVQFTVVGPYPERFLNLCSQGGVGLWSTRRVENGITACCAQCHRPRLEYYAQKSGCALEIGRCSGMKNTARRYRRRTGLWIGAGLLVLLGVGCDDTDEDIEYLAGKLVRLRIFDDEAGVMNLDVVQTDGEILVVSQFTLQASTRKGNRPSYIKAAPEAVSCPLYERFTARVAELLGRGVATGEFGADMQVELVNDGPVTIWMDSKNKE